MTDPREDLTDDSKLWTIFLTVVLEINEQLAYILHGFRCCGLRLKQSKDNYILRPDSGLEWPTEGGYEKDKQQWLMKYGNDIIKALDKLKAVCEGKVEYTQMKIPLHNGIKF